ncbi:four-carbon acid sugar kinase family protein [Spirosoma sp. KNUC1025]|uniref:four-carbon acid sugar kinase family protein n=1 Tax=Spirosoma sp. KNUC1025 TaxID=2894082 RepID=UPI003868EBD8|nr:four-carbon acid sugar kinase family protein [Spirosoma sp. KNUC1025]
MIAVIADDLTGAAELGGIGIAYGMKVELAMSVNPRSTAELLVIATDARSVAEVDAVREMTGVSAALRTMNTELIFKKVDSVLRGHVIAETKAQITVLGLERALIVPANPALGRILIDGHYYVQGQLIHQTHFSKDPEFPITESNVMKRLSANDVSITVQPPTTTSLQSGIVIGEVGTQGDLMAWASRLDDQTLPGGGSGFFTAILEARYALKRTKRLSGTLGLCRLYVCGSAFGHSVELVKKAAMSGNFVCYMPNALMISGGEHQAELTNWVTSIVRCFQRHEQVIIAIDAESDVDTQGLAVQLRTIMAEVVKRVLDQIPVDELIIEGGSTASAVLREIGVKRLSPTQELTAGVVRSAVVGNNHLHITVKPGSYRWPAILWDFNSN